LVHKARKASALQANENSFEAIAREWHTRRTPTLAPAYAKRLGERLENDLYPHIGSLPIDGIDAPELLRVLRRIEARGAIESAHRAKRTAGQVFAYAMASGRCDRNPATDLQKALTPVKGGHFAALTEPKAIGGLLRAIDGYAGSPVVKAALQLQPLVFVRPGELRQAKWSDIDFEVAEWRFTASKTATPHIVPLSRQALAILSELRPLTAHRGVFVFPSDRSAARPMSDNALGAALRRMAFSGEATAHGWRATARTMLDEVLQFPPHIIEHQLAHAVRDPLGRAYNRTAHLAERRIMMQAWADYLDQLRAGAEVIRLHGS
jgi:integrase